MKVVKSNSLIVENSSGSVKKSAIAVGDCSSFNDSASAEQMRMSFVSQGLIHLESGEAIFEIESTEGICITSTDCFSQLVCKDYEKLFQECTSFRYNGSPVGFTICFFNDQNQALGKLVSDAIFKNIGFGRGEGQWRMIEEC